MKLQAITLVVLLGACGGSQPPAATPTTPTTGGTTTSSAASTKETPDQAAHSGSVQISPDILAACGISADDAFFAFDSARLEKKDIKPLDQVAVCFTTGALKGRTMKLIGHADPRGDVDYNMALGQKRADAVQKYIVDKGVAPANVESTSRGAMDATGTDEAGWAHDRRVDVTL